MTENRNEGKEPILLLIEKKIQKYTHEDFT